jgi:hypothetical protein
VPGRGKPAVPAEPELSYSELRKTEGPRKLRILQRLCLRAAGNVFYDGANRQGAVRGIEAGEEIIIKNKISEV